MRSMSDTPPPLRVGDRERRAVDDREEEADDLEDEPEDDD